MKNALICFLKYPDPGKVKTRLAVDLGEIPAAELYRSMAERVITEVYPLENDYDLFLFVDTTDNMERYKSWIGEEWALRPQSNGDLGERLQNACQWALDGGYDRVAVIGSDCVGMDQTFVEEMFTTLDNHDYVIGPSTDGGYYLLAMKASSPWLFEGVEWSTDSVFETTVDKMEMRELKVKKLEDKVDVDTLEDLILLKEHLPEEHFLNHKIDEMVLNRVTLPDDARHLYD